MIRTDKYADFTLIGVCDGVEYECKVHKVILSSYCEYFRGLFDNDPSLTEVRIEIPKPYVLSDTIEGIYTNGSYFKHVSIHSSNISQDLMYIYELCDYFMYNGLQKTLYVLIDRYCTFNDILSHFSTKCPDTIKSLINYKFHAQNDVNKYNKLLNCYKQYGSSVFNVLTEYKHSDLKLYESFNGEFCVLNSNNNYVSTISDTIYNTYGDEIIAHETKYDDIFSKYRDYQPTSDNNNQIYDSDTESLDLLDQI